MDEIAVSRLLENAQKPRQHTFASDQECECYGAQIKHIILVGLALASPEACAAQEEGQVECAMQAAGLGPGQP